MADRDEFYRIPAQLIEIDQPRCLNLYGQAPCTASIGVTGNIKCFNTRGTCQDAENFSGKTEDLFSSELTPVKFGRGGCVTDDGKAYANRQGAENPLLPDSISFFVDRHPSVNDDTVEETIKITSGESFTIFMISAACNSFVNNDDLYVLWQSQTTSAYQISRYDGFSNNRLASIEASTLNLFATDIDVSRESVAAVNASGNQVTIDRRDKETLELLSSNTFAASGAASNASIADSKQEDLWIVTVHLGDLATESSEAFELFKFSRSISLISRQVLVLPLQISGGFKSWYNASIDSDTTNTLHFLSRAPDANDNVMTADAARLSDAVLTLIFSEHESATQLPEKLGAIPSLNSVGINPGQLSVGGTNEKVSPLGTRTTINATFIDHPYSDLLTDPYLDDRSYDPLEQGTFWGKWIARNIYRQGLAVRYRSGYIDPETGNFVDQNTYNFVLEKVDGPTADGKASLQGFDLLRTASPDRAVFPTASSGRLDAGIVNSATEFVLSPTGIGTEYPDSFRCRIGGEGFDVTRSGDTCTITTRGLYGGLESHDKDDTVQVVARMQGQVHDIAYEIITTAIPLLIGAIDKSQWNGIAADFLPRIYSADITEPTGVEALLGELTVTAPIFFYTDVRTNRIILEAIREPSQVSILLDESAALLKDSVSVNEFPKERIDEVWVHYRIRDEAGGVDEEENYSQRMILINPEEQQARGGRRAIKKVYTRWIESGARDTAQEIAQALISRFEQPPVRVEFALDARQGDIWLGSVGRILSRQLQDETGAIRSDRNYQVIQAQESVSGSRFSYVAQSYEFFSPVDPLKVTISIEPEDTTDGADVQQINLRELYNATVAPGFEFSEIVFVVLGGPGEIGGTVIGAGENETFGLINPDNWPWSPEIEVRIEVGGAIATRGGKGGPRSGSDDRGFDGLDAFVVEYPTTINNLGIIGSGGGGGGGATVFNSAIRGGGGAGRIVGEGNTDQTVQQASVLLGQGGTALSGGARTGNGGNLGSPGSARTDTGGNPVAGAGGGSAGRAIVGLSNVTFKTVGDIRGQVI